MVSFSDFFSHIEPLLQVAEGTKHLPHLWDLCSNEIVVRSAKHVLKVNSFYLLNYPRPMCYILSKDRVMVQIEILYVVQLLLPFISD